MKFFLSNLTAVSGKPYILFILLLLAACNDDEPASCVVKEVILRYGEEIQGKHVFMHDGTNYTERQGFSYDQKTKTYSEDTDATTTFTWYDDGRIREARNTGNGYYILNEYTYDDTNPDFTLIDEHYVESIGGATRKDTVYRYHYIESPKDGTYKFDNVVEVYEDGNLVKLGFPSPTGTFEAYDTTWVFPVSYRYDNAPNVIGNYVFRALIYTHNWGNCPNNMIEEIYSYPNVTFSKKQSFAFYGNGQLNKWTFEDTNKNMLFLYECK